MSTTTTDITAAETADLGAAIEELAGRIFTSAVGAMELVNIYVGDRLGYYRALAGSPLTVAELAAATKTEAAYTREWVQGQVISGLITIDGSDLDKARFGLAPGVQETLLDEQSPAYVAPLGQCLAATAKVLPDLLAAFRTGAGVPYAAYGMDAIGAQAALNRPLFVHELVQAWLPQMPTVQERLSDAGRPARVADIGCGAGWSTIALAKAFPHLHLHGFDADEASVAMARRNALAEGVAGRVTFEVCEIAEPDHERYDVAFLFECLHDMAYPDRVLANITASLAPGGQVVVMDERTDETLVPATPDPVQRFFGAASPLWCFPQGRTAPDAHPIGTVMRPAQLAELASGAGLGMRQLDIEHGVFRFYLLTA